jgi:hypothetical protein
VITVRLNILWILLSCLTVAVPIQANASLLSFDVGLDSETRDLIAKLPESLRQEFIRALQQAQPILDQSIEKYIAKVNEAIQESIAHAHCATVGVSKGVGDSLSNP